MRDKHHTSDESAPDERRTVGGSEAVVTTTLSRRPRLADAIVAEIAAEIIRGDLAAGQMLQTEPQLCERFAVSRTVVREAMAQLARDGLVRIRQGAGTVVLSR